MPRRVFYFARTLALFLLLGAIVNIAVAWLAVIVHPSSDGMLRWSGEVNGAGVHAIRYESFALHRTTASVFSSSESGFLCGMVDPKERLAARLDEVVPSWLIQDGLPQFRDMVSAGWPAKGMYCLGDKGSLQVGPLVKQVARQWFGASLPAQVVPVRPLWPGFALNTLFYAAILFALFRGPLIVRRALRRRRGLCLACGYDLRDRGAAHLICPECGASNARVARLSESGARSNPAPASR